MTDRILVVEDDAAILRGLRDNLEGEAYEVLTAGDGEAAYRLIRERQPDLVVLDVMLPRLSGLDLCRRIRGEGVRTPVLMLTAQGEEHDRVCGLDAGADDYVTKPFLLKELLARVRGLLRQRREWTSERELLDRDVRTAAEVQQRLLPGTALRTRALDIAAMCQPARGIGGDYYDVIDLGGGLVALLLADVAGKGITAALTMASLQGRLRTETPRYGQRCGELIEHVNDVLHHTLAPGRFVTLFYAVYDEGARTLTYVNAGHPAPVLVRENGTGALEASLPPLGLFPAVAAEVRSVRLRAGDVVIAFSDGVTEARSPAGNEYGRERLLRVATVERRGSAAMLLRAIADDLRDFTVGSPQADDLTLMVSTVL
jgi:serine phosphatase RsbU (regulator of sigma subunit)